MTKINEIATKTNRAQKRKRELEIEKQELRSQLDRERENSDRQAAELVEAKRARDAATSGNTDSKLADAVTTLKDMIQANSKKKVEPKREFSSNGVKLSPPEFKSMRVDGLMNLGKIDPRCRDMIARNQMIDLFALHPSESYTSVVHKKTITTIDENTGEVTTTTTESPEVKSQQLKSSVKFTSSVTQKNRLGSWRFSVFSPSTRLTILWSFLPSWKKTSGNSL